MVDSIWLLVVPRGGDRLCGVQIWFADGKRHRDYLIFHRRPRINQHARVEGGWWARSLTGAEIKKPGKDFDLRDPEYARMLAERLAAWPLEELEQAAGSKKKSLPRRKGE
jgi:hypothetical protein